MYTVQLSILACSLVLLVWAEVRRQRTPAWNEEYGARRDMALLLLLVALGLGGDLVRTTFSSGSPAFLSVSIAMIVIGGAALFMLSRLISAYRASSRAGSTTGCPRA